MSADRLSALESGYVWLEQPGRPLHVGAVATLEGGPLLDERGRLRLDELRELVAARIEDLPRLRQRIVAGGSRFDRLRWVADPDFDVAHHVDEIVLAPPGGEAMFREAAEEAIAQLFDPQHPPWELRFVTGLAEGRVGLIERAHHALVDGLGGVDLAAVFFDLEPGGRPDGGRVRRAAGDAPGRDAGSPPSGSPAPGGGPGPSLVGVLAPRARAAADVVAGAFAAASRPRATARSAADLVRGVAALAGGPVAPSASLNVACGDRRQLARVRTRVDTVKAVGHGAGGTVNDVVLAAVTSGLRALLIDRGVPLPHAMTLKALVPVSERAAGAGPELGNHVSAVLVPLPVGDGDAARRLATIVAATHRLKHSGESAAVGAFLRAADLLPAPATRAVAQAMHHQPFVNLVVTNVPGPPCPLYIMGAELLDACPVVPLAANLPVGVAILSYNGSLEIGIVADADACPDVEVLARGIAEGFAALGAG